MRKIRLNIRWGIILFGLAFVLIMFNFLLHCHGVNRYNKEDRILTSGQESEDVSVDIHKRGMESDSWEKDNALDVILYGTVYEGTITNSSGSDMPDWKLRIDIQEDCFIANAWCGTVEIHQQTTDGEKVQTIDLRDYTADELTLDYITGGEDKLISLSSGDYIIYHPDTSSVGNEAPIHSSDEVPGSVNIGLIFYSYDDDLAFDSFRMDYHLEKSYFSGSEAMIFIILMPMWGIAALLYAMIIFQMQKYERRLRRKDQTMLETLDVISRFIDAKDPYTQGHSYRVAQYARMIAQKLGMKESDCQDIYYIAALHDIGKCYIPDSILKKAGRLTDEEFEIIKTHTTYGAEMLKNYTTLPNIAAGALNHHERFDGHGYPQGLEGENIPFIARIICVADSYDAMSSSRCYRKALNKETIIAELERCSGSQFDPKIVGVFLDMLRSGEIDIDNPPKPENC